MAQQRPSLFQAAADIIKRGDQPPWWNIGMVVAGVVFFFGFAWSFMSGTGTQTTTAPPPVPVTRTPAVSPAPTATVTAPDPTPAPTSSSPAATVKVPLVSGGAVTVPAAAYDAARAGFSGLYSHQAAATVPMANGEVFPAPTSDSPTALVKSIEVVTDGQSSITFVAETDPDGSGPKPSDYPTMTVVEDGSSWGVTNQQ